LQPKNQSGFIFPPKKPKTTHGNRLKGLSGKILSKLSGALFPWQMVYPWGRKTAQKKRGTKKKTKTLDESPLGPLTELQTAYRGLGGGLGDLIFLFGLETRPAAFVVGAICVIAQKNPTQVYLTSLDLKKTLSGNFWR